MFVKINILLNFPAFQPTNNFDWNSIFCIITDRKTPLFTLRKHGKTHILLIVQLDLCTCGRP